MKSIIKLISLFLFFIVTSCVAPKAVSTIISASYDEKKDQTTYMKFPYGSLSLPGEWTKSFFNQSSGQQNFKNRDSLLTALLINRASSYPFHTKAMTSNQFVKAMFDWDADYLTSQINGNAKIIKHDTVNHFIVWQITADNAKYQIDNINLFGCENGLVFTVMAPSKKLTLEERIKFVQTVFENKTVGTCCN